MAPARFPLHIPAVFPLEIYQKIFYSFSIYVHKKYLLPKPLKEYYMYQQAKFYLYMPSTLPAFFPAQKSAPESPFLPVLSSCYL